MDDSFQDASKVIIRLNGTNFTEITDTADRTHTEGIKRDFMKKIDPFIDELKKCDGHIALDVNFQTKKLNIKFNDLPQDLVDRINNYMMED